MKYFLDTEFIESSKKLNSDKSGQFKPQIVSVPTIDLISIGIVCEDGREYYAVHSECDCKYASPWVKENVLKNIPQYNKAYDDLRGDNSYKKTISEIREEILFFTGQGDVVPQKPEFWGYYCDYDWVVFCQLFGRMTDLPKNYPMYCKDLKQEVDRFAEIRAKRLSLSVESVLEFMKKEAHYPKNPNEHNALADAKWNYELYKYLTKEAL